MTDEKLIALIRRERNLPSDAAAVRYALSRIWSILICERMAKYEGIMKR